ncbi:hypothetical protein JCM10450v2_005026 [Rhodotorula kratochvilovae]
MPANEDEAAQLDTLQALFPSRPRADLRRYLSASRGDLDRAFRALERGQEIVSASTDRPTKRARIKGSGGLDAWVRPAHPEVLVLDSSDDDSASTRASSSRAPPDARKSAFDALRAAPATSTTSTALPPPPTHMTFRHYRRPDFAPLSPVSPSGYSGTPHCACGKGTRCHG